MLRRLFRSLLFLGVCLTVALPALAAERTLTIGVLALRPKADVMARWQPLADYLSRQLAGYQIRLLPLDHQELQQALEQNQLDLIFSNPAHSIVLRQKNSLATVLATLIQDEQGLPLASFGGVIFTRANNVTINRLTDLRGKKVACVGTNGVFCGYLDQAYELKKAGLKLPDDLILQSTGLPQDRVVQAVQNGTADVGFVRSGLLEQMAKEGRISLSGFKIINQQQLPHYPFLLSTRLYPEWSLMALPHLQEGVARRITAELLLLEPDSPTARKAGIYGFSVPSNYQPVENLLRELRLPPFDNTPSFTFRDVWQRYFWQLLLTLLAIAGITVLAMRLGVANRRLAASRKEAERSASQLQSLVKTMPDLIWFKDQEGVYLSCNPRFESFFGASEGEIRGKTDYDFVDKELADSFREHDRKAMAAAGPSVNQEWISFASDGHRELLETIKCPVFDKEGQLLGVLGVARDITALTQAVEELRASKARWQFALDSAGDGIWDWNMQTGEVFFSRRWKAMLGYTEEEIGSSLDEWDSRLHPDDREQVYADLQAYLAGKSSSYRNEHRIRHKNGSYLWILDRGIVVEWSEENKALRMIGTHTDMTERRQYEEQLKQARRAADAANRAKSEFLANMSHEIRTPMNGVIGMAQLLRFTQPNSEQLEYLDALELSCNNLLALISDILDLSKIEAGKIELEQADFSLRHSIQEVIVTQSSRARQKGLTIATEIDERLPGLVQGDSLRFKQILLNLLGNAIKFTEQGSITISIVITSCQDTTCLYRLAVQDSGIGMTADQLERIFNSFEQADNSTTRKFGGSGLGLSICRRLTELMGGRIWAESVPGQSSTFYVELPFTSRTEIVEPKPEALVNHSELAGSRPLKVLIAEDNQLNASTTAAMLLRMGHQAELAENGKQALEKWHQSIFDCILMDIQMPVMDGRLAVATIRGQEAKMGGHTPIIALTAHALRGDREQFLAEGFDGYIAKPVEMRELARELLRVTVS